MKKFLATAALVLLLASQCYAAWDPNLPADNSKLKDTPAYIRANNAAIATGTDANLCVSNAKVCTAAAIVDTKMAQITTAAKVSGAALTLLGSIPSSANGQVPIANGGTGQSTATAAATALLPAQAGNSGKSLITNATVQSWGYPASLTIASAATGDILYYNAGTSLWARLAAGTSGYYLKAAGAAAPVWTQPNVASGPVVLDGSAKLPAVDGSALTGITSGRELFISSGTFTAPAGISIVFISACGSGGGGGGGRPGNSGSGGGGGGAYTIRRAVVVTPSAGHAVVIGDAGISGAANTTGGDGGDVTFAGASETLTFKGGKGGVSQAGGGAGGAGGLITGVAIDDGVIGSGTRAGGGQKQTAGGAGGAGTGSATYAGGGGGGGAFGLGGTGAPNGSDPGGAGTGFGAGGGGAGSAGVGGVGTKGMVYIEW